MAESLSPSLLLSSMEMVIVLPAMVSKSLLRLTLFTVIGWGSGDWTMATEFSANFRASSLIVGTVTKLAKLVSSCFGGQRGDSALLDP